MLEIAIIFCLGIALFLLLRHYPEAGAEGSVSGGQNIKKIFSYFNRLKKNRNSEDIREVIEKDQEDIVAPAEVESASAVYNEPDPDLAKMLFQAEEAFCSNDLRSAEEKSLDVIAKNKRSAQAYVILGKIAFQRGQFEDAKEAFKTALRAQKDLGEPHFYLGKIDLRNENLSGAVDNLQKSIYMEKGHADWYAELGRAYMEIRQYAKAAKVLKRATSLDIDNKEYKELAAEAEEKQRTHAIYSRGR